MQRKFTSVCCGAPAVEDFQATMQGDISVMTSVFTCLECEKDCEIEPVCDICGGTGEVTTYTRDAETGYNYVEDDTKPCICQLQEEDSN